MEDAIFNDNEGKPSFDFRNDYYKIVRWHLVLFGRSYIVKDYESGLRILQDLYTNVQPFFTDEERKTLKPKMQTVRALLYQRDAFSYKDHAFQIMRQEAELTAENALLDVKEELLLLLKRYNMLLPVTQGRPAGFDENIFMHESD